ncbi:MAG: type I restriction enzyme HsdR N-terminal domain-containing protein [Bacteroidia bacterium]|nr:type I restriction enzyme HsdR N-terminal domain-containing protein [Bacteroidia bacterium]NNC86580.1 type I restriction enzyme HsdR N-terminal domain-containing protein [Bacteroidia bacterium]
MLKLNLPECDLKVRSLKQSKQIFDVIRKKYVELTPEEWVRQNLIHFLINDQKYPANYFSVEKMLRVNKSPRRTDVVIYDNNLNPWMIIECKAPTIDLDESVLFQATKYNSVLGAKYLLISNGMQSFIFEYENETINQQSEFPDYKL